MAQVITSPSIASTKQSTSAHFEMTIPSQKNGKKNVWLYSQSWFHNAKSWINAPPETAIIFLCSHKKAAHRSEWSCLECCRCCESYSNDSQRVKFHRHRFCGWILVTLDVFLCRAEDFVYHFNLIHKNRLRFFTLCTHCAPTKTISTPKCKWKQKKDARNGRL